MESHRDPNSIGPLSQWDRQCTFLHAPVFGEILSRPWLEQRRLQPCNTGVDKTSAANPLYRSVSTIGKKKKKKNIASNSSAKLENASLPKHGHVVLQCVLEKAT